MGFLDNVKGTANQTLNPVGQAGERPAEPDREGTDDPAGTGAEQDDAYERAQPDSQPETSSEPEPDEDPANAG